ncbi:MAG: endonuclease [Erysipelotrichia bacterium]|nr:endonuclease [Erysipelotrichia bacterium]
MLKKILRMFGIIILAVVLAFTLLVAFLSVREFKPKQTEEIAVETTEADSSVKPVRQGDSLTVLSWNIGFGALDKDEDFFMDGGRMSRTSSRDKVQNSITEIIQTVNSQNADAVFIQEIDRGSDRSYQINEYQIMQSAAGLNQVHSSFANNYKCDYVPYPLQGMLGKVDSGLAIFTNFETKNAVRESLPVPFKWPISIANLKRCLLVERIPIEGSDRELVLINLHLEAYDDGEGKAAQTKQLLSFLETEYAKGNYIIAGGDFNQSFPGIDETVYAIKNPDLWMPAALDTASLADNWSVAADDSVPTCRLLNQPYDPSSDATQYYVIDGFLVSPNITVHTAETLDENFEYSDHNPIKLNVTLK